MKVKNTRSAIAVSATSNAIEDIIEYVQREGIDHRTTLVKVRPTKDLTDL